MSTVLAREMGPAGVMVSRVRCASCRRVYVTRTWPSVVRRLRSCTACYRRAGLIVNISVATRESLVSLAQTRRQTPAETVEALILREARRYEHRRRAQR